MPTKILHKRNNQQGAQPTTSSIDLGQLAINTYDGKLFLKKSGSNNDEIVQAVTTDSITQGSVYLSGSLTVSNSFESSGSATNIFTVYSKVIEFDANQIDLSGSLTITGSAIIPSLTGSLFGTSSWANTAISASYTPTLQQITDSGNTTTNDIIITGSLTVSGSSTFTNIGPAYFLDGNVGIGTTTPAAKLEIQSPTVPTLMLRKQGNTGYALISGSSGLGFEFKTYNSGEVDAMKITKDGKVGIGTTSPSYKLEVDGTADFGNTITLNNGAAGLLGWNANVKTKLVSYYPALSLGANSTEDLLWISGTGNVGINTTTPSHPLDVSGSGRFTTSLTSSALVVSSSSTNVAKIIGSGSSAPLFEVIGSQGQLFSVVDSFSGSLFSINDISGLPLFDVDSNGDITVGDYFSPALIASGSVTTIPTQLTIGNVNITPLSQSLQTTQNYVTSSVAGLFYSKMDSVYYADGDPSDVDLLSGSTSTIYGSRNVPSSFFTGSGTYKSKVMSMRVVGSITFGNNKSLDTYIKIGNAVIPSTIYSTGNVDKTTAHPFELLADLIFNNGQVSVCSSVRYCDESYTYKAYPLSDLFETTSSIDLSGNIQLFVSASSTVAQMTASYSTIEFKN